MIILLNAMIRIFNVPGWIGLLSLILILSSASPAAKETTIYIVRHAEKDTSDPRDNDPSLNAEGKIRVLALNEFLKKEKISAVFATNYKRTMQTVALVAQRNGIPVKSYDSKDPEALVKLVKSEFVNQKVLIAGHSNTILELVKAFGQAAPFEKLNDDDYDLIFKITIHKTGESSLKVKRFGKEHHSTRIPESQPVP